MHTKHHDLKLTPVIDRLPIERIPHMSGIFSYLVEPVITEPDDDVPEYTVPIALCSYNIDIICIC